MEDQAPHVLVVDDDADTCQVIKALLRSEGYQVTCTTSSVEGLALASKKCFDLILLDNWMPGLGGIPLCKSIRLLDEQTPVLFVSAAAYESDQKEALTAGAQDYLIKPIDLDKLLSRVRAITGNSG